ncbi:MAG: hypothetical protein ACPIOQ_05090 [Promethearchaeia archaeon]
MQVGNDTARDAPKHSAAFILRAAIAAVIPSAGLCQACSSSCGAPVFRLSPQWSCPQEPRASVGSTIVSDVLCVRSRCDVRMCSRGILGDMTMVHYDKRGAKITVAYEGDDCSAKKVCMCLCVCSLCVDTLWHVKFTQPSALISRAQDEVEQVANKFCAENTAMGSLTLSAADKTALEAFAGCAAAGEVGGVTLKKFSANAAKKCIVAEYIVGGGGAKKDSVSASGFVPHHLAQSHFQTNRLQALRRMHPRKMPACPPLPRKSLLPRRTTMYQLSPNS